MSRRVASHAFAENPIFFFKFQMLQQYTNTINFTIAFTTISTHIKLYVIGQKKKIRLNMISHRTMYKYYKAVFLIYFTPLLNMSFVF